MIIASLTTIPLTLTYIEFSRYLPKTGGAIHYIAYTLGNKFATIVAFLLAYDQIVMISYGALGIANYLTVFSPVINTWPIKSIIAISIVLTLMIINIIGIKLSARIHFKVLTLDILLVLSLLIFSLIINPLNTKLINLHKTIINPDKFFEGLSYAFRGYIGLEVIVQTGSEVIKPTQSIPLSLSFSSLYLSLTSVFISTLMILYVPPEVILTHFEKPITTIVQYVSNNPYLTIYATIVAFLMLILAVNSGIVDFSRTLYALSELGQLPKHLIKLHSKFKSPYIAIITACFIACLFLIPGDITLIANAYGLASLICYLITVIAHTKLINSKELKPVIPRLKISNRKIPLSTLLGIVIYSTGISLIIYFRPISILYLLTWLICISITIFLIHRIVK